MAATGSLKIVKRATKDGATKLFSNTYHLNNTPASNADWQTLADAVVAAEKAIVPGSVTIIGADGYAAGSAVAVFSASYTVAGTLSTVNSNGSPLEVSMLARFSTTQRTTKNHPVYLFKYWRGVLLAQQGALDPPVLSAQHTAALAYANAWVSGFVVGATTYKLAGPNGAVAQAASVGSYPTHRDFPN